MKNVRKDYDKAEKLYKRSLNADSSSASVHYNYANLLKHVRKNYQMAEKHYRRAIQIDDNHADALGNLANMLSDIFEKYDEADSFYRKAVRVDPKHADNLGNYADFLADIRKDIGCATKMYKQALEANPKHVYNLHNYSQFLLITRHDHVAAEKLLGVEVLGQTTLMLLGLILIQRIITFIPTYSGDEYKTSNLITVVLPFLMIILSLQTKMGEKCNILYKRAIDTWNGNRGFENFEEEGDDNDQGGKVTTSQPIATKTSQKSETAGMSPQLPPPMVQSNKETRPQIANGGGMGAGNSQLGPNPLDSGIAAFNDGFSGGFGSAY